MTLKELSPDNTHDMNSVISALFVLLQIKLCYVLKQTDHFTVDCIILPWKKRVIHGMTLKTVVHV